MVPNWPGARVSGPDDWKNRMSSGAAVVDEADLVVCGLPVLQGASPAAGLMLLEM